MPAWSPTLIPRKTFNGRRLTQTLDGYNLPSQAESNFLIENASAQPTPGDDAFAGLELYRDKTLYKLFTTTPVFGPDEGTSNLGDLVEVETGRWFRVLRVRNWDVGVRTHYEAILVEENER